MLHRAWRVETEWAVNAPMQFTNSILCQLCMQLNSLFPVTAVTLPLGFTTLGKQGWRSQVLVSSHSMRCLSGQSLTGTFRRALSHKSKGRGSSCLPMLI